MLSDLITGSQGVRTFDQNSPVSSNLHMQINAANQRGKLSVAAFEILSNS